MVYVARATIAARLCRVGGCDNPAAYRSSICVACEMAGRGARMPRLERAAQLNLTAETYEREHPYTPMHRRVRVVCVLCGRESRQLGPCPQPHCGGQMLVESA